MQLKPFLTFLFYLLCLLPCEAQPLRIGGIINQYAGVTDIDYCTNRITVNNAAGFSAGQKVIMMQMKGAFIITNNNMNFGTVLDYNSCGNYEINTIEQVNGNQVTFRYAIVRNYDKTGIVQLISLPEYSSATTDTVLHAKSWDGLTGGVFAIKADTLILTENINVSGIGFRGAALENEPNCWNGGSGGSNEFYCPDATCGARKGEGIGNTPNPYGRGKNANGGGGGNDHNTGGGGGSNYGAGGIGGLRTNVSQFSCPGPGPGVGGQALAYDTALNKLFMGGGGGAGDENNNEGTAGANGGGICIVIAKVLVGNNVQILANGNTVRDTARSDGAGGGGAGGTVVLSVDNYLGALRVSAIGGNGGRLDNGGSYSFCFGPGAGGGGGALWVKGNSLHPGITLVDTGGLNGYSVFGISPPACPFGTTNFAQPGQPGGSITNLNIIEARDTFIQVTATACCDTIVCPASEISLTANGTLTYPPVTYAWSNGATTQTINPIVLFNQSYAVTVTDHRGCQATDAVSASAAEPNVYVTSQPDTAVLLGQSVQLTAIADTSVVSYQWSPATWLSSTTLPNPQAAPETTTTYCVTVSNTYNCTATACQTIELLIPDVKVPDAFSPNGDGVNDELTIFVGNYAFIQSIEIFNRWGEVIFKSLSNAAWNGTHKGKLQNAGMYVCRVVYSSPLNPNKSETVVKNITLIR